MTLQDTVADLTDQLLTRTEQLARGGHGVTRPTVWALHPDRDPATFGSVTTRAFYKGVDAVRAIGRLGVFPAVLRAPMVLITFEQADLFSALGVDDGQTPTALVTVLADNAGHHRVTIHPCEFYPLGHQAAGGLGPFGVRWDASRDLDDINLPFPIQDVVDRWQRHPRPDHDGIVREITDLRDDGYAVTLNPELGTVEALPGPDTRLRRREDA